MIGKYSLVPRPDSHLFQYCTPKSGRYVVCVTCIEKLGIGLGDKTWSGGSGRLNDPSSLN